MKVPLLLALLLLAAPAAASPDVWSWITGAASSSPNFVSVSLFDQAVVVGTANPGSHGNAKAIAAGETLKIVIEDARRSGEVIAQATAVITIRQHGKEVITLTGEVIDGESLVLFEIPATWGRNYHLEVEVSGQGARVRSQNEFKVQGYGCEPVQERCDGEDNDCDGAIDELEPRTCGATDEGVCSFGSQECSRGYWSACSGLVEPDLEICDGKDNDCDGLVDESIERSCGTDEGTCSAGLQTCQEGGWGSCGADYVGPTEEVCDGVDNNCDGEIDEGADCQCEHGEERACGSDEGSCEQGTQRCLRGQWGECSDVGATEELCNGIDDDCDGSVDEHLVDACGSTIGACSLGTRTCDSGAWGPCESQTDASEEVCDGVDNDCDGQVDESLARACGSGGCLNGQQICENGVWGACSDLSGPMPDICDGLDNDCDGEIDEDLRRPCGCDCAQSRVLVVKDRGHHNEDTQDFELTFELLERQRINFDVIDEPKNGLRESDLDGYDLIWFINPGWPQDTRVTFDTLKHYYDNGNPLVLQGDDMTWGRGELGKADIEPLTHLHNINNGLDRDYNVKFEDKNHPLLTFLRGAEFLYHDDDIDTSTVAGDDVAVLAWGEAIGKPNYRGPAVTVRDGTDNDAGILLLTLLTLSKIEPQWQAEALVGSTVNWLLNKAGKCECGIDVGRCSQSTQMCESGEWSACEGVPPINEVCNAIDDDCDGELDEGIICECIDGRTESCGTDVGECTLGRRTCQAGVWSDCEGGLRPQNERCNGKDDDCDGDIDESIVLTCGTNNNPPCTFGVRLCVGGELTECTGAITPEQEMCDQIDNDCDGEVDEGACECASGQVRVCEGPLGACSAGTQRCDKGMWAECTGATDPSPEVCNGIDDDCDGEIDENIARSCGSNIGACQEGAQLCQAGEWQACSGIVSAQAESCNGLDDDCDGIVDNGINCECVNGQTQSCGSGIGECTEGSQTCQNGRWAACSGAEPSPEVCDGLDNDCDGIIDENLLRLCGESDVGLCSLGTQTCSSGAWAVCAGEKKPQSESCDGKDNDCDGFVDEGCITSKGIRGGIGVKPRATGPMSYSEDRRSAQLEVKIVSMPEQLDAIDPQFGVLARVTNVGEAALPNIVVDGTATTGWTGESQPIGSLDPDQSRDVTLSFTNVLCPPDRRPSSPVPEELGVQLRAHSGDVADTDEAQRNVRSPPLGLIVTPMEDELRTCVVVDNKGRPAGRKLEVEIEVYDQSRDIIVDLVSPLRVGADEIFLTSRDYPLRSLKTPKPYRVRANLFEGGTLFTSNYHVAEARAVVDLTNHEFKPTFSLYDFINSFFGVFR